MSAIPSIDKTLHDSNTFKIGLSGLPLKKDLTDAIQQPHYSVDYEFHAYKDLTDDSICVVLWSYFTINPSIVYNTVDYKALFLYEFAHSMNPYLNSDSPFTFDQYNLIDLSATSPNTINNTSMESKSTSVTHSVSFGANGSLGFMMGEAMGQLGGSYSDTTSKGYSQSITQNITDWSILETSSSAELPVCASWIHHQSFPYDIYKLGPENFSKWWREAYSNVKHRPNPLKDIPDLSWATMKCSANATWRFPKSVIHSLPSKTLWFNMVRSFYLACITNNKKSDNDHNRIGAITLMDHKSYPLEIDTLLNPST